MRTSLKAQKEIQATEKFVGKAYLDQAGIWTFGFGYIDGVKEGDTITLEEAYARWPRELAKYEKCVNEVCEGVPTTQNQFDAMVSLCYNIGVDKKNGFPSSTVAKAHRRGDYLSAQRAFSLWNKVTDPVTKQKKVSNGLTTRRNKEAARYGTPDDPATAEPMPQNPTPETSLAKSPIMQVSVGATSVTTALGIASETTGYVRSIRENLGDLVVPLIIIAALVIGGTLIYWRWKQKQQGYA